MRLVDAFSEITSRWSEKNLTSPDDYTVGSGKKVWVRCLKCDQDVLRKIADIVYKPDSCSVCSGKIVVPGINDFASSHPILASEWSERNELRPDQVVATGGAQKAWFDCRQCGNSWYVSIGWRVSKGNSCPYCANQKVMPGFNDLATTCPKMLDEWDYERNDLSPTEVTDGSNRKVHWVCRKGHRWKGTPASRILRSTGQLRSCLRCSQDGSRSKGEKELAEYVSKHSSIETSCRTIIKKCEFDIVDFKNRWIFEYNGEYWHSSSFFRKKHGKDSHTWHLERQQKAFEKGFDLFYVWENDWQNFRGDVENAIDRVYEKDEVSPLLAKTKGVMG